jgi:hypothetical protein
MTEKSVLVELKGSLDFSGLDARSTNLHPFDGLVDERLYRLKIWKPSPLVMRVPVRTQEGIATTSRRSLSANITTFSHVRLPVMNSKEWCTEFLAVP